MGDVARSPLFSLQIYKSSKRFPAWFFPKFKRDIGLHQDGHSYIYIYLWVVTSLSYPMEKYRSLWSGCFPCVGNGARPTFACKDTRRSEACRVITSPRSFQRLSYGLHINKEQMKSYRNNKCPVLSIKVNRSSSSYHNFFHRILHGCAKPSIDSAGCRKPSKGNMIRRPDHLSASHFVLNPP